jgi:hypothetical protein
MMGKMISINQNISGGKMVLLRQSGKTENRVMIPKIKKNRGPCMQSLEDYAEACK